jgi:branched-chain amino acid transport system permease protein
MNHRQAVPLFNKGRVLTWGGFALLLVIAPQIFSGDLGMTILSQIGIAIIACLSFNILLGLGGMLSFGHAVYSGLGAFVAMHALNAVAAGTLALPVSLVPVVGGLSGMGFAALFGYVTTRKSGTTFSMITLGVGELVFSMSLMVPEFFGGEGGVTGNRVIGGSVLGITFGPASQLYYLIAGYTFVCVLAMFAFTQTPLGTMLNAVRDNPERVDFVGYNTQRVRYLAFIIAGFFAGIAGGLGALNFEIVTAEVLGSAKSGAYLLFTFLGGTGLFYGPIIGAVLMVLALAIFSGFTQAWLLYLGLIFMFMVTYAPGGIAGVLSANMRMLAHGKFRALSRHYLGLLLTLLLALAGASALIEMLYQLQFNVSESADLKYLGTTLNVLSLTNWLGAGAFCGAGLVLFTFARNRFTQEWSRIQESMEQEQSPKRAA